MYDHGNRRKKKGIEEVTDALSLTLPDSSLPPDTQLSVAATSLTLDNEPSFLQLLR
ncbi:unnamed protein product, partial [Brassica oleracea var. botrytis]